MSITLGQYIADQKEWSLKTFGGAKRVEGICKHIEKELGEIRSNPSDVMEWVDVVILALDGAWRAGYSPREVKEALYQKQQKNFSRQWPELSDENQPTEHIRKE